MRNFARRLTGGVVCALAAVVVSGDVWAGPNCGNGTLDAAEACDDGNTISGDGCSSLCRIERVLPAVASAHTRVARVHADRLTATAYVHANFGDVEVRRGGLGAALGYTTGHLGVELDIDRHSHFYKDKNLTSIPNPCVPGVVGPCVDNDTDAWIVTANLVGVAPLAMATRWRFYGTAGVGLIYAWIHDAGEYDRDQTHLSFNLGVGAMYWLTNWLGFRLDVRYFHAFVDDDYPDGGYASDYDFARISLGVSFAPVVW